MYAVNINPEKVLSLSTLADVHTFTKKYIFVADSDKFFPSSISNFARIINWALVGKEYDGIEINPYIGEARLDPKTFWYYSWDVVSGCIWEPSVLLGCELLAECPIPKPKRRNRNEDEEVQRECGS